MKNRLTAMTLAIILFTAVLMNLSCKDTSPNTTTSSNTAGNTATNVNQKNSAQNSESDSTLAIDCSPTNPDRRQEAFDKIEDNIEANDFLNRQYSNDKFDFDVVINNNDLVLYIWGVVQTKKEDRVDDLNKTYKKLIKKGCVAKVIFGEPTDDTTITSRGFEYNLCESPNGVCADGVCRQGCLLLDSEDDKNTNASSNR